MLNTPKTITVLSKEVLADKNVTSLREIGRSTAGVTLGSGEGGNAFGDRFFIRGFDARNELLCAFDQMFKFFVHFGLQRPPIQR